MTHKSTLSHNKWPNMRVSLKAVKSCSWKSISEKHIDINTIFSWWSKSINNITKNQTMFFKCKDWSARWVSVNRSVYFLLYFFIDSFYLIYLFFLDSFVYWPSRHFSNPKGIIFYSGAFSGGIWTWLIFISAPFPYDYISTWIF